MPYYYEDAFPPHIIDAFHKMTPPPKHTLQEICQFIENKYHPIALDNEWAITKLELDNESEYGHLFRAYEFPKTLLFNYFDSDDIGRWQDDMIDYRRRLDRLLTCAHLPIAQRAIEKTQYLLSGNSIVLLLTQDDCYLSSLQAMTHLPSKIRIEICYLSGSRCCIRPYTPMYIQYLLDIGYLQV